jgi:Putative binding domain, N-terminal/Viral BACON domain
MLKPCLLTVILATAATATDYHVGPGQTYGQIGQVPWYNLKPGDTVYIHYQPTPYYEKFLISGRGTPNQWIRVLGVPGPNGELPIISGNNATTSKNNHYRWQDPTGDNAIQWDGVIQIAVRADDASGSAPLPGYIEVANLQVQDGYKTYSFFAENGTKANYEGFAACIYARSAQHILIRNNILTNCGQGFYNWTGSGSNWWDGLEADTILRGNYFYNNGQANSYTEHQTYTESDGVTIEYNRFGAQRAGSLGSQLKDRSAGTVIRYNYIEASPQGWMLDLVEPQESWDALGKKATYSQAFVYGNMLVNKGVSDPNIVHWNEDHQAGQGRATVPGGRLYFYDNTVLTVANKSDMSSFSVFNETWGAYECPAAQPGVIDLRNNIFAVLPRTPGSAIPTMQLAYCGFEKFDLGVNWVSPGWVAHGGTVTGANNMFVAPINDPGFVSLPNNDVHLLPGSSAAGLGQALPAAVTSNTLGLDLRPTLQYVYHTQVTARPSAGGAGSDLGAFDSGAPAGCNYAVSPQSDSFAAAGGSDTISVTTGNGCGWSASTSTPWLTINSGASGTGYGLVNFAVGANTSTSARSGSLVVAGQTVPITQAGISCTYSISPGNASAAAAGATGSVTVTAGAGCGWTAASGAGWITVTSGASGSGNGTVGYSVAANTATSARSGNVTIAGQTFTVSQTAASSACTYSISPGSTTVAAAGGTGSLAVTSGTGCSWTAVSSGGWISITSGASGSGNGTVGYSVSTNSATTARNGSITIAGKGFAVSQAAAATTPGNPCTYSVSPSPVSVPAGGGTVNLTMTAPTGCAWNASSNANWITISSATGGSGTGTITLVITANTGSARSTTITVPPSAVTINQSGPTPAPAGQVSFQQGVSGYTGGVDRTISSMYASENWNGGIGVTDPAGNTLELKNDAEYEAHPLIRFGGISIPANATVVSATLTITFDTWIDTSPTVTGYYLAAPWNATAKASGLNWKNRDTGAVWAVPGTGGSDLVAGKAFTFTGFQSSGRQAKTVQLDPAVVQDWIQKPATNQGIVLMLSKQNGGNGIVNAYSAESANATLRPVLTITYK